MPYLSDRLLGVWFAPLSVLYGAFVLARRFAYDRGWLPSYAASVTVVSVGGIDVGGSGKTPVTAFLIEALSRAGRQPGLASRGYGRRRKGLHVHLTSEQVDPARFGDEAAMLASRFPSIPIAVANHRIEAARVLQSHCKTLVLDDAFSHRALSRQIDIVVMRGDQARDHLLPWGRLREPPSSLRRATVVWRNVDSQQDVQKPVWFDDLCPQAIHVVSQAQNAPPCDLHGNVFEESAADFLLVAGIAQPQAFITGAGRYGKVLHTCLFPDHHNYGVKDVENIQSLQQRLGAAQVVTTAKDAVKLRQLWPNHELLILDLHLTILVGVNELAKLLDIAPQYLSH